MENHSTDRRKFLVGAGAVAAIGVGFGASSLDAQEQEKPEKISAELVGKFVGKSHGDIKSVKELLEKEPALINATWDWGNGDWESGLGAASHVGRRDIAEFLIESGARLDAFAATMLGIKPIVKQMLVAFPKLHAVKGPHQICLLSHSIYGKEKADEVFDLLIDSGADIESRTGQQSTPLMAAAGVGRVRAVEILLAKGADANAKNSKDLTALDIAKKRKKKEVVAILEKLKA